MRFAFGEYVHISQFARAQNRFLRDHLASPYPHRGEKNKHANNLFFPALSFPFLYTFTIN